MPDSVVNIIIFVVAGIFLLPTLLTFIFHLMSGGFIPTLIVLGIIGLAVYQLIHVWGD